MLINEYILLGHEVTLIAHPQSKPSKDCKLITYRSEKEDLLYNTYLITKTYLKYEFDIIHSFSRLLYIMPLLPFGVQKIMSYQREPTISQIRKALLVSRKNTLVFTGCSDYISKQISSVGESHTIYNGVALELFHFNKHVAIDAPLVFLGRIEHIKGAHLAIEIAIKTNRKLIIAGNIPLEHELYFDEKIKPFLNEKIKYIGPVNDQQKNELLQNAAAFLMPILWDEPYGIVMAEAMACGTPVIGLSRGSVPEVVANGISGFVCNSLDDMVEAVGKINMINREAVRLEVELKFSSKVVADNYIRLYNTRLELV